LKTGVDVETAVYQKEWLKAGRKTTKFLVVDGVSKSVEEWCADRKLNRTTVEERLERGWRTKDAIMLPLGSRKPGTEIVLVHGTVTGYSYHKCRCDLCKKAKSDYRKSTESEPGRLLAPA
jgi:hypothetical protein